MLRQDSGAVAIIRVVDVGGTPDLLCTRLAGMRSPGVFSSTSRIENIPLSDSYTNQSNCEPWDQPSTTARPLIIRACSEISPKHHVSSRSSHWPGMQPTAAPACFCKHLLTTTTLLETNVIPKPNNRVTTPHYEVLNRCWIWNIEIAPCAFALPAKPRM